MTAKKIPVPGTFLRDTGEIDINSFLYNLVLLK